MFTPRFKIVFKEIRNPLFTLDAIQKSVRKSIQQWVHDSVGRVGVTILFRVPLVPVASKSTLDLIQNGTAWGRKHLSTIVCPCSRSGYDHFLRLDG